MEDDLQHLAPGQPGNEPVIVDASIETFEKEVFEASMTRPVLVDFWAPWCGPCKQLTPTLEKLVEVAEGKIKLVKVNIDENQQLAAQLRIQSVPTVYAFVEGRGVDGFQGALPESQLKAFIERLVGDLGESPAEELIGHGTALLEEGDIQAAAGAFSAALEAESDNVAALAGLAQCHIALGNRDEAEAILGHVPPAKQSDPAVAAARAALELSAGGTQIEQIDTAPLEARIAANPKDFEARQELAEAQIAMEQFEEAMDTLVASIALDRKWNDEAARKKLITLFDMLGPTDERTVDGRRKLSSVLFS